MDGRPWGVLARREMGPALLGACSHLKSQQQAHFHPSACRDPNFPTTGAWRASAACKYLSGWVLRPRAPPLETLLGSGAVTCSDARKVGKGHYMKPLSSTYTLIRVFANLQVHENQFVSLFEIQSPRLICQGFSLSEIGAGLRNVPFPPPALLW